MFKISRERRKKIRKISVLGINNHRSAAVRGGARRVRPPLDPLVKGATDTYQQNQICEQYKTRLHMPYGKKCLSTILINGTNDMAPSSWNTINIIWQASTCQSHSLSARWLVAFQSLVDCLRLGSGPMVPGAEGDGLWGTMGVGAPVSRSGLPGLWGTEWQLADCAFLIGGTRRNV